MKTKLYEAKFMTYEPQPEEFKIAQGRTPIGPPKPYTPKPHPQAQRLSEALKK